MFERAEHWTFDTTVKATNIAAAYKALRKDYPQRDYRIVSVRSVYSAD